MTRKFKEIAVVGAGNMGSGIAQKYATEGFSVRLVDMSEDALKKGTSRIDAMLEEAVSRRIFREEQAAAISDRIHPTLDWKDLERTDLVVEAVFEDLKVKREVFERLASVTREDCVLATNTSSFYVKQLASTTSHPERVVGLHYFYHPAKNRLVEVISGPQTPEDLFRDLWALQERIGKTPIRSADAPGFVVNRFFVPWINEAARLYDEEVADIPTIEQAAIEAFRIGMGPFQLMNVTGIPIGYHAAATLERELGPFYKPAELLREYMESGDSFAFEGNADRSKFPAVQERLLGVAFHVASQLVSEGVGTIEDTDIGARVGLRWSKGPFELMNLRGIEETVRIADVVETKYSLPQPKLLAEHFEVGRPFAIQFVHTEVEDGVAYVRINRPDAMNALNPQVVEQLAASMDAMMDDDQVRGIVLSGAGKAFVAGADIRFFLKHMNAGTHDQVVAFAAEGHRLLNGIETGPKPVVAQVDGLALGGGLELALACDQIIASEKGVMAFPETGIGIFPGLGGTQRPSRRFGVLLTKWLVYTGQMVDARTAAAIGLVDQAVSTEELPAAVREAALSEKKATSRLGKAVETPESVRGDERMGRLVDFFERYSVDALLEGDANGEAHDHPELAKLLAKVRTKAPLALRAAEQVIRDGGAESLARGLEMELAQMAEIFRTQDAVEGLSTMGKDANFTGK